MEVVQIEKEAGEEIIKQSEAAFQTDPNGYLHITNIRILWTKPAIREAAFSLPFSKIEALKRSHENQDPHPILAIRSPVEDGKDATWVFRFISLTKWKDLKGFYDLLQQSVKPFKEQRRKQKLEQAQIATSKQRADLLARNEDLRTIYARLVPSTLSEEEFWESRTDLIAKESTLQQQKLGMSTAMLTNLKPTSEINRHVYRLTPQIIHQIFVEYPPVRDVYEEYVPHKITEKQFWKKYFQSGYFHRIRQQNVSTRPYRPINTACDDIFMRCESIADDLVPKIQLSEVDCGVDLTKEEDCGVGFGAPLDSAMDIDRLEDSISIIRRYNRHSTLVLENPPPSAPGGVAKKEKTKGSLDHIIGAKRPRELTEDERNKKRLCSLLDQTILDDLEGVSQAEYVPLNIKNQRRYFQTNSNAMDLSSDTDPVFDKFSNALASWNPQIEDTKVDSDLCFNVLAAITTPARNKDAESKKEVKLDAEHAKQLKADFLEANELLRHFWGCFPISDRKKLKKAKRLEKVLGDYYSKLDAIRTNKLKSTNLQEKEYGTQLLPIINSIHQAITIFEKNGSH